MLGAPRPVSQSRPCLDSNQPAADTPQNRVPVRGCKETKMYEYEDAALPDWTFEAQEVSMGVLRIRGKHRLGRMIELVGFDSNELIEDAKTIATLLDRGHIWTIRADATWRV
jgi:hypothetical protein